MFKWLKKRRVNPIEAVEQPKTDPAIARIERADKRKVPLRKFMNEFLNTTPVYRIKHEDPDHCLYLFARRSTI